MKRRNEIFRAFWGLALGAVIACAAPAGDSPDAGTAGLNAGAPDAGGTFTVQRIPLHEEFSGANCGPCEQAAENMERVFDEFPDQYTMVSYQMGSDKYITEECKRRRFFYLPPGAEQYSIPQVWVDGVHGFHPNEINADEGYLAANFEEYRSVPSQMKLEATYSIDGQTVETDIKVVAGGDFPSEELRLHVAIVESRTVNNVGINGQTEFHNVLKKMLPGHLGTVLRPMIAGDSDELNLSFAFQGEYNADTGMRDMVDHATEHTVENFDNLQVVVWVQDTWTRAVHQSTAAVRVTE
jgi:hypothetical protein